MAKKFYFFKTVRIGGRQRLRPLSGQTDEFGKPIDETLNVQADSHMREAYPIGTVFGSDNIEFRTLYTEFYSAGNIYPLGLDISSLQNLDHHPPKEMIEAYNNFSESPAPGTTMQQVLFTAKGEAVPQGSLLDQLKTDERMKGQTIEKEGFYVNQKD